jgi:hypothetical protein
VRHAAEVAILGVGVGIGDIAVGSATITVIHGANEDLLTAAFILAASAGVSVSIARHGARAVAIVARTA